MFAPRDRHTLSWKIIIDVSLTACHLELKQGYTFSILIPLLSLSLYICLALVFLTPATCERDRKQLIQCPPGTLKQMFGRSDLSLSVSVSICLSLSLYICLFHSLCHSLVSPRLLPVNVIENNWSSALQELSGRCVAGQITYSKGKREGKGILKKLRYRIHP